MFLNYVLFDHVRFGSLLHNLCFDFEMVKYGAKTNILNSVFLIWFIFLFLNYFEQKYDIGYFIFFFK